MVPEGWQQLPLELVSDVQTGISKSAQRVLADPVERPYLRVANVQDGFLDLSEVKTIVVERSQLLQYSLQDGDVLLTEGGDFDKLGRGTVWRGEIENCLHQNHVFVVRPHREVLCPFFLSASMGSLYGKRYFLQCAKQTTNLASINSSQLRAFPVLLPPIKEQRAIIQVVQSWERAIDLIEQRIIAGQERKHGLMQQLLTGKRRFGEFEGEAWQKYPAGEVFAPVSRRKNGNEALLSVTQERGVIPRSLLQTRVVMPAGDTSGFKLVEPGDFIISLRTFQGGIEYSSHRGIVSPAYTVLDSGEKRHEHGTAPEEHDGVSCSRFQQEVWPCSPISYTTLSSYAPS
ncbi:MAG TPA: restriction endonuclease subunit S, partial [Herpetosiphonaceae bacterium]|nr:restriction endonuclease subunit S [Herpetosiphonaceae bacterium]